MKSHPLYHFETEDITIADSDKEWTLINLFPKVQNALEKTNYKTGRIDFDQSTISQWGMYSKVVKHFDDLGLKIKRFATLYGRPTAGGTQIRFAHLDSLSVAEKSAPVTGRFNIPITGQSPAVIDWWDYDYSNPDARWETRVMGEVHNGVVATGTSIVSKINWDRIQPAFTSVDPGIGWNRTNVAHRINYNANNLSVNRFLITAEIAPFADGTYITWNELSSRLQALGY